MSTPSWAGISLTRTRFLTDYFHTVIIMAIACYFTVQAFTNSDVDSVGKLYDLVQAAGQLHPVSGNAQGSYLTMTSKSVCISLSLSLYRMQGRG